MEETPVRRGDIWWLDWSPGRGSEQRGQRPALVIQNDLGNRYSPTTIVSAVTTRGGDYPFIVLVSAPESGLPRDSFVNLAQILTVDKSRLMRRSGRLDQQKMREVDSAIRISLGLDRIE